jgi:cytidylate kinase
MAIITLSKGIFSGARELARRVSENLGYSLVSREEIVEKTAQYGLPGSRLEWARCRRLGVLARKDLEWMHYLVYARAALTKEIRQGSLIYLGSDGHTLLRDFPTVLHVRVVADMEHRIRNLIRRTDYAMNQKKARQLIEKIDAKAARWKRTIYDDHLHDASDFDLIIEPEMMSLAEASDLIGATAGQPQFQTTGKALEAIDLLTVAAELRARIAMKEDVADDNVGVEVQGGVIVVTGSVRSSEDLDGIKELFN